MPGMGGRGRGTPGQKRSVLSRSEREASLCLQDMLLAAGLGSLFVLLGEDCHVQLMERGQRAGCVLDSSAQQIFTKCSPRVGTVCRVSVGIVRRNVRALVSFLAFPRVARSRLLGQRVSDPQTLSSLRPGWRRVPGGVAWLLLLVSVVDCLESTLEKSLQAKFPSDLKVSILLDFTRGSRGRKNSRTMLLPLLQRFPEQVRVSLFHTPNLRGLLRLLMPERFNETIGLQHIKVYLFDNNVILSGANLSDSYFTNRQDRYVFLQDCPEIADFFTELVDAVGDVSLQLQGDDTVQVVEGMVHPYKGDRAAYCRAANKRVMDVINSAKARQQVLHAQTFHGDSLLTQEDAAAAGDRRPAPDTWIYPLIQMKPFEIQIDEIVTETLLTEAERGAKVYLTTGYFNLTQAYMDLVLGTRAEYQILLASPEVNGFFGAKGVAGAIPAAYVHIERQFYGEVCSLGQQERVRLQEYWRRGWTFHAKGQFTGTWRPRSP
ncbi:CDP-diacylglycerol--glycerol-3-phosphate 3-phosphatidyltransferase, mitochondrial isoform X3 [Prionailurus bengalensis]|uniref:CDP-diacylglycerol--glycerol-3-phosphate 3-phosphatidyltransferase, mitochondrial isoform X3 n=1 Tax=Prionailurus bengalensis TaxID=37029 RepID=UPI001CAA2EBE|nr:CDP-diacylglycerol--glycerol-3-phosphate 3-phosphatidyltransferase, mitochondrial isoform X3 [Prionailurus bengalensis]